MISSAVSASDALGDWLCDLLDKVDNKSIEWRIATEALYYSHGSLSFFDTIIKSEGRDDMAISLFYRSDPMTFFDTHYVQINFIVQQALLESTPVIHRSGDLTSDYGRFAFMQIVKKLRNQRESEKR